jgi:hypothetical protein
MGTLQAVAHLLGWPTRGRHQEAKKWEKSEQLHVDVRTMRMVECRGRVRELGVFDLSETTRRGLGLESEE